MNKNFFLLSLFCCLILEEKAVSQNFLSNLSATKNSPVYSTYAASLERSEFIVDEGYQFVWYDPLRGINFETDKGGILSLAFKLKGDIRYQLNQLYQEPIITSSYSDLVKYFYYPFPKVRVEVFFLVYSSRIAIQDINIINESDSTIVLSLYPFLNINNDFITNASYRIEDNCFVFKHKEPPDDWTIQHGIPYFENLFDVLLIDTTADSFGGYLSLGDNPFIIKEANAQNYCVEWGEVRHSDNTPCVHTPPYVQQIIFRNDRLSEILTEEAPKWGDVDPNIPGNGYQGCELGNFQKPQIAIGDSFTVLFTCTHTNKQGLGKGKFTSLPAPMGIRTDIFLNNFYPTTPQNVLIHFSQNNNAAVLSWTKVSGYYYTVYRRTASTPGRYDLIADSVADNGYLDSDLNPDSTYGYVLIAKDSLGRLSGHSIEVGNIESPLTAFFSDIQNQHLSNSIPTGNLKVAAFQKNFTIHAGETTRLRFIRGVTEYSDSVFNLINQCKNLKTLDLNNFILADEQLYRNIPRITFSNPDYEMTYWNAFSLLRQCMLPPEAQCNFNYYVFSREPTWGWGHGGQVFHESLAMLAYVFMDSMSAMNSQRVYFERQHSDGYINYRTGPYLNETIPYAGKLTTSAPWLSWENWEIYKKSRDISFLVEAYQSGRKFYEYWINNRDSDHDGLCEWGAHGVLESVRDGRTVIWDKVAWPANFEAVDLNTMLVCEAQSLAEMAKELGYPDEYFYWTQQALSRTDSINKYMWDPNTEFYYHVHKTDHDFTYSTINDLKRMEIIGFLPLWAGIASTQQAEKLIQHLKNPNKFWRSYGIPSLSASDSYYNPSGYWNGPVWIQWQYLIFRGLLRYGYVNEARQLVEKILQNVIHQLKTNHNFWELYSPDYLWAGWNKTYIWTGIIARFFIDLSNLSTEVEIEQKLNHNLKFDLYQNFPNPFNSLSKIKYQLAMSGYVTLRVYDVLGREIATLVNGYKPAGHYEVMLDSVNFSNGIYFYTLTTDKFIQTKKMVLLR